MNTSAITPALLAQLEWVSKLKDLSRGFTGQAAESNITVVLLAVGGLCGLAWAIDRLYRIRQNRRNAQLADLLAHSARLLALKRGELRTLRAVSTRAGLAVPAAMLLSPANLAHALKLALRAEDDPRLQQRLNLLAVKLFDTSLPSGDAD